jgi:PPM family protein phosphatase
MWVQRMHCEFFSLTHVGRVRQNNEDALAVVPQAGLAVLADGMGGYSAGEVASEMATRTVLEQLAPALERSRQEGWKADIARLMARSVAAANSAVFEASRHTPAYRGMGTTLVVVVFQHKRLLVGHIGDSRLYRWRNGELLALTRDHSMLQQQIDAGLITPGVARFAPYKNLLTRALGMEDEVRLDVAEHDLAPDDVYLLCSDGLNDMLSDEHMAEILTDHPDMETAGQALMDAANAAGGRDNISLIMARCVPENTGTGQLAGAIAR